jgi:hypothetical protein
VGIVRNPTTLLYAEVKQNNRKEWEGAVYREETRLQYICRQLRGKMGELLTKREVRITFSPSHYGVNGGMQTSQICLDFLHYQFPHLPRRRYRLDFHFSPGLMGH